jgi:hypothetical protein
MASVEMILTALQTGYGGADPESSGAYDELCALVRNAFADNSRALRALEEFLDDPETHERPLVKALSETGVDSNPDIGAAAARVLQLQPSHRKDLVDHIVEREQIRTGDRFTRMAEGISDLKAQEEAASQERMERFWEEEHRRREAIAERQARLWRQQQQIVIGVAAIGIIILVVFIVILIVTASR